MRHALSLLVSPNGVDARPVECQRDVPIAALVVAPDGQVLSQAVNRREADGHPLAHAEVLALQQAAQQQGDGWRLSDCTLVVTVEPCVMCAGAAVNSRIGRIVFGAWEPKTGACGSLLDVVRAPGATFVPQVTGGVLEEECARVVQNFFRAQRG